MNRLSIPGPVCECPDMQCDLALPLTWEQYYETRLEQPALILIANTCPTQHSYQLVRRRDGFTEYQVQESTNNIAVT